MRSSVKHYIKSKELNFGNMWLTEDECLQLFKGRITLYWKDGDIHTYWLVSDTIAEVNYYFGQLLRCGLMWYGNKKMVMGNIKYVRVEFFNSPTQTMLANMYIADLYTKVCERWCIYNEVV